MTIVYYQAWIKLTKVICKSGYKKLIRQNSRMHKKKDKQENLEWVESHFKKRCCLFRLLDPEIDSKNHGFLNFQDTPLIPYDNLWLHNMLEIIYFYILKIPSTENLCWKRRLVKVHIFWEGHKILRNLHQLFDCQYIGQIIGGDFAKFCGLLRIYQL